MCDLIYFCSQRRTKKNFSWRGRNRNSIGFREHWLWLAKGPVDPVKFPRAWWIFFYNQKFDLEVWLNSLWQSYFKFVLEFSNFSWKWRSGIKHTVTLSSLKSSPSVLSTFKDIANLYSPMKELEPNDVGHRCKPMHQPIVSTLISSLYRGNNDSLLGYYFWLEVFSLYTINWICWLCICSENYVTPNGPQRNLVTGPNSSLRRSTDTYNSRFLMSPEQRVTVQGPNATNRHGPKVTPCISLSSFIANKFKKESMRRL